MLNYVKRKFDLESESFAQDSILHKHFVEVLNFIHAGRNRALHHLTLDHEKVVYKEHRALTPEKPQKEGGFLSRVAESFKKLGK